MVNLCFELGLVGRRAEQAEVRALLERSRLVTLTGTGGCGKTRLAIEVATGLSRFYPDGVCMVELAPPVFVSGLAGAA